ncbi:MAG: serine hydrolase domain-containing protein [Pirellulaceae bacterium]|jgi:N-acyl-D-amino-acid deacylase|nr:serine hydrolase domain-containing protein [Pirellulaceae bacterium]
MIQRRLFVLIGLSVLLAAAPSRGDEPIAMGKVREALASFDKMMVDFVAENEIPGAALAVAKDGRLMYARGFGYADVEARAAVKPDSLFRIASISKPITAVGVMQMVERGKLPLDKPVMSKLPHKPFLPGGLKTDDRLAQITLRHLLQHRGGWDRNASIDPMFNAIEIAHALKKKPPAGSDDVIRYILGWRLDFDPGAQYAYSNFGYCVLGRLMEEVSGRSYEESIQRAVLRPIGVKRMAVGRTLAEHRREGEVRYYTRGDKTGLSVFSDPVGEKVPRPYGAWHLEAMDSHGAWIASAIDLVRFGSCVQHDKPAKLLSAKTKEQMFQPPAGWKAPPDDAQGRYYVCGWSARDVGDGRRNFWHTGSLPGTSTILVLRHDGLCWAVLFNTRELPDGKIPSGKVDPLVHQAADAVKEWPDPLPWP